MSNPDDLSRLLAPLFPQLQGGLTESEKRVYLDNAATTLTPEPVLQAMESYYHSYRANIHRGVYRESERASEAYEKARVEAARFIGAQYPEEIIFTSGTTEGINLLARSLFDDEKEERYRKGRENLTVTMLEHHSNLLPWAAVARRRDASLSCIQLKGDGSLDLEDLERAIPESTALVALTALSNVTGELVDLSRIIARAREVGALVVVDAAQAAGRVKFDVKSLDPDFLVFSGHKCYGPTGTGVLYGKRELLENLAPLRLGGGMVESVTMDNGMDNAKQFLQWDPRLLPGRHEGGTMNIAGCIGLGEAFRWLSEIGMERIANHDKQLYDYCREEMKKVKQLRLLVPEKSKASGVISFTIDSVHPHDAVSYLDAQGFALRGGLHCAEPLHRALGVSASVRASFGIYTSEEEITGFISALRETVTFFS